MKPLPSSARALYLGLSLFLATVLAACGGGGTAADPDAQASKTQDIRCAP